MLAFNRPDFNRRSGRNTGPGGGGGGGGLGSGSSSGGHTRRKTSDIVLTASSPTSPGGSGYHLGVVNPSRTHATSMSATELDAPSSQRGTGIASTTAASTSTSSTAATAAAAASDASLFAASSFSPPGAFEDLEDTNVEIALSSKKQKVVQRQPSQLPNNPTAAAAALAVAADSNTTARVDTKDAIPARAAIAAMMNNTDSDSDLDEQLRTQQQQQQQQHPQQQQQQPINGAAGMKEKRPTKIMQSLTQQQQEQLVKQLEEQRAVAVPERTEAEFSSKELISKMNVQMPPKCDVPSALSSMIGGSKSIQRTMPLRCFIAFAANNKRPLNLTVPDTCTVDDVILAALKQYSEETQTSPPYDSTNAYILRVAVSNGNPDDDLPALEKRTSIKRLGFDTFILMLNAGFRQGGDEEAKRRNIESVVSKRRELESRDRLLEDVVLRLSVPARESKPEMTVASSKTSTKYLPVAPDMMIRELMSVIAQKLGFEPDKHVLKLVIDGKEMDIPQTLLDKTVRLLELEHVVVKRLFEESSSASVQEVPALDSKKSVKHFFSRQTASQYKEFEVVKVNKYGTRQDRILGIDGEKLYNMKPRTNRKTKNPERNVDDIVAVNFIEDKPRCFTIECPDETLYYEAKTPDLADYIVAKLRYLLTNRNQERTKPSGEAALDGKRRVARLGKRMSFRFFNPMANLETTSDL